MNGIIAHIQAYRRARLLLRLAYAGSILAMITGVAAGAATSTVRNATLATVFPIFGSLPGFPFECTGWYTAPVSGAPSVSVYLTAGHCPSPLLVRTPDGFEDTLIVARFHSREAGADLTIAESVDARIRRTFLRLAPTLPRPGDRAVVVGYVGGHVTSLVVTAASECQQPFVCFHSSTYIKNGLSGSPIVSLTTGQVVGILVASPERQDRGDPYVVLATPATVVRTALQFVLPRLYQP